jgi:hypothetical protein
VLICHPRVLELLICFQVAHRRTEAALAQQDGAHPKVRNGPKASASPKVATEHAPKRPADLFRVPSGGDAATARCSKREQLYQEFLNGRVG